MAFGATRELGLNSERPDDSVRSGDPSGGEPQAVRGIGERSSLAGGRGARCCPQRHLASPGQISLPRQTGASCAVGAVEAQKHKTRQ
jgi:hypothetical protein